MGPAAAAAVAGAGSHAAGTGGGGSWYDDLYAWKMQNGMRSYEVAIGPVKQRLFARLFDVLKNSEGTDRRPLR